MGLFSFTSTLAESLQFRRLLPWIGVLILGLILGRAWPQLVADSTPITTYGDVSTLMVFRVLPLLSAIATSAILGQEIEQKTIVYLLTRSIPRSTLLLTRFLASCVFVFIVTTSIAVAVCYATMGASGLGSSVFRHDMLAILIGSVAYGSLFLAISTLLNRSMLISLLYAFGWELSVPNMPGAMSKLALATHILTISNHPVPANRNEVLAVITGSPVSTETGTTAWISLLVAIVLSLGVAVFCFNTLAYIPREDAE